MIDRWGISSENAPRGASLDLTDDKSTLVQVMAWYYKNIPLDPRKATKLIIVTCSAIWCEAQQQCWRLIATFEKEHMHVLFV